MKQLILLGGGGHCGAVADVARGTGFVIAGVLCHDDAISRGLMRLDSDDWLDAAKARDYTYMIAVGQVHVSPLRARLFGELMSRGLDVCTLIASDAYCAHGSSMGLGSVLMRRSVVGPNVRIGQNCIVNTGAIIEHDVVVDDHCHISTGAILNGGVRIGCGTLIGSGAVILQQASICESVVIGAGSVVIDDVSSPGVYVGAPARRIK